MPVLYRGRTVPKVKDIFCEVFYETRLPRGVETPVVDWSQQQTREKFAEKIGQQFYQWRT